VGALGMGRRREEGPTAPPAASGDGAA
jgi:hypothetical protein